MTESNETRLARLEASRDDHAERLRTLFPVVSMYAVQEERIGNLKADVNTGLIGVREDVTEVKTDIVALKKELKDDKDQRARERRQTLSALFVAGMGLVGTFVLQLLQGGHP